MQNETETNSRLKELQELIELGEMVSVKIESLRETVAGMRDKVLYQLIGVYIAVASAGYVFMQSMSSDLATYRLPMQLAVTLVLVAAIFIFFRSFTSAIRQRKKLGREIEVESDILSRLVRMIYDQFKLVQSTEELSAVTRALIEMRIQRLQSV